MSSVKSILQKNYMNNIFEASDGFFLTVADDVQFTDPKDIYSPIKIDMVYIDDEEVMVLYEACKQYKKLLDEDTTQTTTQTATQTKEDLSESIIAIIKGNKHVTLKEITEKLNKTRDGIKYHITKMQKAGKIRHIGKVNDGYWEITN